MAPYGFFVSKYSDCKVPEQWLRDGDNRPDGYWDFAMIPIPDGFATADQPNGRTARLFWP